ncbi:nuclear transport factor 2 family protein [Paraburkholderia sp. ZP32-5]|uniref:nuclear transport factor 2 family protein n=1 Tax=Paraburkholderia sp. ZP32-5 TaxID=2883245 RepID=UPI001F36B94F|nr:nuclear transport factor 2 family protein [Paraburkholderia sp. ZP32-5]
MNQHNLDTLAAVVFEFFHGLDTRNHAATAQFMAREGIWRRQGTELVGPEAVLAVLEKRDASRRTAHLITNLRLAEATDTTARLRYYVTAFEHAVSADGQNSPTQMAGVLDSTDDLVLEDGQWRIQYKSSQRLLAG